MSSSVLDLLKARTINGLWAWLAIVAYLVASGASIVWGLSGRETPENPLSAEVVWDDSTGFPSLAVTNRSDEDWTTVRFVLDGRYYHEVRRVPEGQTVAISAGQFEDGYLLPRPDAMHAYERNIRRTRPAQPLRSPDYRPQEVQVLADQGDAIEPIPR